MPKIRINEPLLRKLGTGKNWILEENYELSALGNTFTVPKGFTFDLASVPECLHWVIDEDELGVAAPLIHDVIYRHNGAMPEGWSYPTLTFNRREADYFLYHIAMLSGAPKRRALAAWLAVRLFSRRW